MALGELPPEDQPAYLTLPKGTVIPIELPPMCVVQGGDRDTAIAHACALNTPKFPVLRRIILSEINERIAAWQ